MLNRCLNKVVSRNDTLEKKTEIHRPKCNQLEYGLEVIECVLISSYTGHTSKWINSELKESGINTDTCKEEVKLFFNSGLDKMPSYNNEVVFHHIKNLELEGIKKYLIIKENQIVKFPTFLSASKDNWGREFVLKIKTSNRSRAVDLEKFNPEEKEVLFNSGSCFKVISVNEGIAQLEEIEYDSFVGEANIITTNEISKITTYR